MTALRLSDLSRDAWTTAALQPRPGFWDWRLLRHDRNALVMAREAGRIITVQVRETDGVKDWFELRARIASGAGDRL